MARESTLGTEVGGDTERMGMGREVCINRKSDVCDPPRENKPQMLKGTRAGVNKEPRGYFSVGLGVDSKIPYILGSWSAQIADQLGRFSWEICV